MRSVCSLALLLATACATAPTAPAASRRALKRAVVGVVITAQGPDWSAPWNRHRPNTVRVNGVVVEGRRILLEAQHLAHATMIEVEKLGDSKRFAAEPILVDPELPLGLLAVDNPEFWAGLEPLPVARDVDTDAEVTLARWLPSGQFERTSGTVRQVSVRSHYPAESALLSLEISSPIKGAGWSEVAVENGAIAGIVTSAADDQLNAIAAPVIAQFLDAAANEKPYRGVPRAGFSWQALVNPATRDALGLAEEGGVLVRRVMPKSSVAGVLEPGDVLLEVAGERIGSTGKFDHPRFGKMPFSVLFSAARPGEAVSMRVLRAGKLESLSATLVRIDPGSSLVPPYQFGGDSEYLEVGGLVFHALSKPYLEQWKEWWTRAPLRLLVELDRRGTWPGEDGERVIVLNRVLPDECNLGYEEAGAQILKKANGKAIRSLAELGEALATPVGGFHIFEFLVSSPTPRIVLDAERCAAAGARIEERYGVP